MRVISIKDIKDSANMAEYADDDIMTSNSLTDIMDGHGSVRIYFFLIIICIEGRLQINVGDETYTMKKNDMLTCVPSTIIGNMQPGSTHKVKVFGFSPYFMQRLTAGENNIDRIMGLMKDMPLRNLHSTLIDPSTLALYGEIIMRKASDSTPNFKEKIMKSIFTAFFCEIMAETSVHLDSSSAHVKETGRANIVYSNFLKALACDDGTHRTVNYFADKLCYSPKYLSYVVKQVSGRTATAWINEQAMEIIKHHLRYSDRSVKEIADMLNFPNLSFFGKYVKRHTGISPVAYRNQLNGIK